MSEAYKLDKKMLVKRFNEATIVGYSVGDLGVIAILLPSTLKTLENIITSVSWKESDLARADWIIKSGDICEFRNKLGFYEKTLFLGFSGNLCVPYKVKSEDWKTSFFCDKIRPIFSKHNSPVCQ